MGGKAIPQNDYWTVYDVIQIFAVVLFEAGLASSHVEVRNHTNTTHSATPSKHTYDTQPPLYSLS